MTSSSRCSERNPRSLAAYQTPSVPEGWYGRDLVRIVDPVGLAIAWLSPAHAGAVIGFDTRVSVDSPWITLLRTAADLKSTAAFVDLEAGQRRALAESGPPWTLLRRDPTSATFVNADASLEVMGMCENGELRMVLNGRVSALASIEFNQLDAGDPAPLLRIETSRTRGTLEIRFFESREVVASDDL